MTRIKSPALIDLAPPTDRAEIAAKVRAVATAGFFQRQVWDLAGSKSEAYDALVLCCHLAPGMGKAAIYAHQTIADFAAKSLVTSTASALMG